MLEHPCGSAAAVLGEHFQAPVNQAQEAPRRWQVARKAWVSSVLTVTSFLERCWPDHLLTRRCIMLRPDDVVTLAS